ncbi:MAG: hypothetical protein LBL83_01980 [Clostridiales bacterium]|jgi:urease accessory protein|nr:hypothetical protein [Clostridiales bacterium]
MIIEKALGKLGDAAFAGRAADVLDIEWFNAHKKIDRRTTRGGKDVGIRLDGRAAQRGLSQGDVVFDGGGGSGDDIITVNIIPCECIAVRARSTAQLVRLCYEIGNRHAPFFYGDGDSEGELGGMGMCESTSAGECRSDSKGADFGEIRGESEGDGRGESHCESAGDSECAVEFLTPSDRPIMEMLEKIGLEPRLVEARLLPEKRISSAMGGGHSHSHAHDHAHEHEHAHSHEHEHEHAHPHEHPHAHERPH